MPRIAFAFALAFALAAPATAKPVSPPDVGVGPQYDTTHVYVPQDQFDQFVASFSATFGGTTSKQGEFRVTPTPSLTKSQLVLTPVGTLSVFGFKTLVPYPFGEERTGYLVTDMDKAVAAARKHGAIRRLADFPDPIGRDVVIQWPGGVNMQLYWHTATPHYAPLATIPENRVYLTADAAGAFIRHWAGFAHAKITADNTTAPGVEIGQPGQVIRRVSLSSAFGKMVVFVSNGHLPWPYGHDVTGYQVADIAATIEKAKANGAQVLVAPFAVGARQSAILRFPGGYIAEVHDGA